MSQRTISDGRSEHYFLSEFRRTGAKFAQMASLAGAAMAIAFALLMIGSDERDLNQEKRQLIRLALATLLLVVGGVIRFKPAIVEKHYLFWVGAPAAIACYTVAILGFIPTEVELPRSGRLTIAMAVTCFMVYGFTRLPVLLSAAICTSAAALAVVGSVRNGDDYVGALVIYLVMTNLSGAVLAMQIERRERDLFARTMDLIEARERVLASAKASADASAAKSYVLAAVNHDLRQPVTSASLYLEALRRDLNGLEAGQLHIVEKIQDCVGAINDGLSRLAIGAFPKSVDAFQSVEPTAVDLIFERLESVYSVPATERGVAIKFLGRRRKGLYVLTDGPRLWDVLSNLLSNSIKFSADSRRAWVVVSATRIKDLVRISVKDNGVGIESRFHERIFEEYFQVPAPFGGSSKGYGLGLSIVRKLLAQLPGHEIKFASEVGRGTRFDIWLPLCDSFEGGGPAGTEGGEARGYGKETGFGWMRRPKWVESPFRDRDLLSGCYALVVEDDTLVRSALVETMEGWGMLVEAAGSADEALALVKGAERLFDVVVSDFGLPGGTNGVGLIDAVRGEQGQPTPAIILSGQLASIDASSLRELAVRALSKPVAPNRLKAELEACLASAD